MNGRPPEEILLLQCLRSVITDDPQFEPQANINWETVLKLAVSHNLVPFLSLALPHYDLPAEISTKITTETRRRKMRAAVMIQDFKAIHQQLVADGIRVMPIKGIALAHTIYPSVSLRYFDDLDLLVPAEDGPRTLEAIKKVGFIIHPRAPKPDWHHLPPYIHHKHNTMVEIHTDLVRRAGSGWDIEGIWQRANKATLDGLDTWLMSDEDALIYTALHARHNLYNRLSYFLDGLLLARKIPPGSANQQQLAVRAREAGGQAALAHILATGSNLFALEPESIPQLSRPTSAKWLANKTGGWQSLQPGRSALKQGPLTKLIELLLMDSLGDSLRLAGRLIIPESEFVSEGYGDGENKTASYGKRLWQRLNLAAGQLLKVVRNK
jgi:hypothetical protein